LAVLSLGFGKGNEIWRVRGRIGRKSQAK